MDTGKNIRAFLAIEPSEHVLQAISRVQDKLRREINGQISWTKSQSQHLTLKFFDNISLQDVENISAFAKKRAGLQMPFSLAAERLGVFPDIRRPRVLWVGIAGNPGRLLTLQDALDDDFETLCFARENRVYRPHITLARIKALQGMGSIEKVLGRHDRFSAGEFIVRELILFQSKLTPQGAVYDKLAVFPLEG